LQDPGRLIDKVNSVNPDPLASIRYTCVYWIEHLCHLYKIGSPYDKVGLYNSRTVDVFLQKHFLYWLEALSLIRSIPSTVAIIRELEILLAVSFYSLTSEVFELS
jgi:hypothetical protein